MEFKSTNNKGVALIEIESLTRKMLIGHVSQTIVTLASYPYFPGPIYIGPSNVDHMKKYHLKDFVAYHKNISSIIRAPDYVGINPNDGSLQFIKMYDQQVLIGVRFTGSGNVYYARSLYSITQDRFDDYLKAGRLVASASN
ncbi:MAG: PBECR3 domain-containing polyvalent protein [Bacilli bacterium]